MCTRVCERESVCECGRGGHGHAYAVRVYRVRFVCAGMRRASFVCECTGMWRARVCEGEIMGSTSCEERLELPPKSLTCMYPPPHVTCLYPPPRHPKSHSSYAPRTHLVRTSTWRSAALDPHAVPPPPFFFPPPMRGSNAALASLRVRHLSRSPARTLGARLRVGHCCLAHGRICMRIKG